MPVATLDSLKEKTTRLKKKLAENGDALEGPAARALKKRIRRTQRARRSMEARAARLAGKAQKKEG